MRLYQTFDKERLTEIARLADNRQIIKDVNYAAFLVFHGARNIYCEWFDSAFINCHDRSISKEMLSNYRVMHDERSPWARLCETLVGACRKSRVDGGGCNS